MSVQEILAGYDSLQADQEDFYRDLHQHPELSHQEHRTAGRVAGQLQEYGCTVQYGIGGTGVVGVLSNGDGPTVLLRADMDVVAAGMGHRYLVAVSVLGGRGARVIRASVLFDRQSVHISPQ